MYRDFYYFKDDPFEITPSPDFFFFSKSHREALAAVIYGVKKRKGFITVISDVGLGKTTVVRHYLAKIADENIKVIYIFNSNVSFKGLLKIIYQELDLNKKRRDDYEKVNHLHKVLIDEYKEGRNIVFIVDEAQNMPVETLENLRMLSNLETSSEKLIQIVLIGQPELEDVLNSYELRQLKQRIAVRATITRLSKKESLEYIQHRLSKVDAGNKQIFTNRALELIIEQAKGVPRVLNILCDNALITGYGYQKNPIDSKIIKEVLNDFKGNYKKNRKKPGIETFILIKMFRCSISAISSLANKIADFFDETRRVYLLKWSLAVSFSILIVAGMLWINVSDTLDSAYEIPPYSLKHMTEPDKTAISEDNKIAEISEEHIPELKKVAKPIAEPIVKIVKSGDTLSNLTSEVYGFTKRYRLVEFVQQHNPHIKDIHKLTVGDKIIFPEIPDRKNNEKLSQVWGNRESNNYSLEKTYN